MKISLQTALAAAGVEASTIETIIAAVWQTMDVATLVTLASTAGLAVVLAHPVVTEILADSGLEESTVAAVAAAATAAEAELAAADVEDDAAKQRTGAVVGGVVAGIGVLALIVGVLIMMVKRDDLTRALPSNSAASSMGKAKEKSPVDSSAGFSGIAISRQMTALSAGELEIVSVAEVGVERGATQAFVNPVYDGNI